jgi:hypothetical protein
MSEPKRAEAWAWTALAGMAGAAVEVGVAATSHRREAWDAPTYWVIGLPVMMVAAFLAGLAEKHHFVRIGYAPFAGQLVAMVVRTGGGSMLPVGMILLGVIGLSGVLAAFVGSRIGQRTV